MRTKRTLSTRASILFVIVCILVGGLAGLVIEKAQATCLPQSRVVVAKSCTTAAVTSPRNGVRKYKRERLGHLGKARYSAKAKRVIVNKLMREQRRQARHGRATTSLGRAGMWQLFKANDTCMFKVSPNGPNTAVWTCNGPFTPFPDDADWDGEDVDAVLCGGLAGIGAGGALAAGVTGPWTWVGLGAGWAVCQWGDNWKRRVE